MVSYKGCEDVRGEQYRGVAQKDSLLHISDRNFAVVHLLRMGQNFSM